MTKKVTSLENVIMSVEGNPWTTRDAASGTIVFGASGSGKSSGPLRKMAISFLESGYGGIVFCAKTDECDTWLAYAKETGRQKDVIRTSQETFNFLNYELKRPTEEGGGMVENVVNIFMEVVNITKDKRSKGSTNDEYWQNAIKQFLRNTIALLGLAGEPVTLINIKKVIDTIPDAKRAGVFKSYMEHFELFCASPGVDSLRDHASAGDFVEAKKRFDQTVKEEKGNEWHKEGKSASEIYCLSLLARAMFLTGGFCPDYELAFNYFTTEYPELDERTKTNAKSSFTVLADSMLRGEFRRCFCSDSTTLDIESVYKDGKIIIVDRDVKRYGVVGKMAAAIMKLCFEKMIERRPDINDNNALPVFLWADECQYFAIDYDQMFQTTARSSRTLTVYATQNLANLIDGYGKEKAESLLGNLTTKFFCQNGSFETNEWAAKAIGEEIIRRRSQNLGDSSSHGLKSDYNKSNSYSEGWSEQKDKIVQIVMFTTLQRGGPREQCKVGFILWQSGRIFNHGRVFLSSTIEQKCRQMCGARRERKCPDAPELGVDNKGEAYFFAKDYLNMVVLAGSAAIVFYGLQMIYGNRDILILPFFDVTVITVATFLIWFASIVFDRAFVLSKVFLSVCWCLSRGRKRAKIKVLNGMPLYAVSVGYFSGSVILAIVLQKAIYCGESLLPYVVVWIASAGIHRLLGRTGAREISGAEKC